MNLTRKMFLFVFGLILLAPIVGCGVGTTEAESHRTVMRVTDYDARMLVDDIGVLTQYNHPLHTSRWVVD